MRHCSYRLSAELRQNLKSEVIAMSTKDVLVSNLKILMRHKGWNKSELARQSKISLRMINYILSGERAPSIDVADQLAGAFGLSGWQMMKPNLPEDLLSSPTLSKLLDAYASASPDGRKMIDLVAERESKYRTVNGSD